MSFLPLLQHYAPILCSEIFSVLNYCLSLTIAWLQQTAWINVQYFGNSFNKYTKQITKKTSKRIYCETTSLILFAMHGMQYNIKIFYNMFMHAAEQTTL